MGRIWKKLFGTKHEVNLKESSVNIDDLDASLNLLRSTTLQVSQAAISAARVLESQLHDSESRFLSVIDDVADIVIVKDPENRWLTLNKFGQNIFGWHHDEYKDKTTGELAETHIRFKDTLYTCKYTDELAWESRKPYRTEIEVPTHDSYHVFDTVKTPVFDDEGNPKELIIIGRDITDARERQRRTRACFTALNSASDKIFILDTQGRVFFCNDKFTIEFNVDSYEKVVGKHIWEILPMDNYTEMWSTVTDNEVWEGLCCNKYKLTVLPMMNGAPHPIYYICTLKSMIEE